VQAETNAMPSCLMHQQACCGQWLLCYMYVQQKVYTYTWKLIYLTKWQPGCF